MPAAAEKLGTVELPPNEARACAIAAYRYRVGSEKYFGCRDGFLDGYGNGLGHFLAAKAGGRGDGWFAGYFVGRDVGIHAKSTDLRSIEWERELAQGGVQ